MSYNPTRRHFLKHMAGASAVLAAGVPFMQKLQAQAPQAQRRNKSLIIVWCSGGPPTIDYLDMKPGAPTGGEHRPIDTTVPGIRISEHMPILARQAQHFAIIRSLNSNEGDHMRGTVKMNTGRSPDPLINYPHIGSVVALKNATRDAALPPFISVGGVGQRIGPGFLGMTFAPFTVQNPGQMPENIAAPQGVGDDRLSRRQGIFTALENNFASSTGMQTDPAQAHRDVYTRAFRLAGASGREVFTIDATRERDMLQRYGDNGFGRGCLLARKLVEAGAVCVEVEIGGWDLHNNIFPTLANQRLPMLDRGLGTLIDDLNQRGLLQNTLVVLMGDFGRTPRINQNAGRDHWSRCWSVLLAGGNIRGGQVYGETNADGTDVRDNPVTVPDLFATIYQGLGIDPTPESNASVRDNLGRPYAIAGDGQIIRPLIRG